jgi:hypothetical protein
LTTHLLRLINILWLPLCRINKFGFYFPRRLLRSPILVGHQCSSVPPKVIIFAWRAASNGLATEENKRHHGMRVTGVCNICGARPESVAHALAECPHARRLWERMRMVWSLSSALELVGSPLVSSCYLKPSGSLGGYYPTGCLARMVYTQRSHP